ncbi:MAG TPA: hypothetical protein VNS63_14420 [Blastocatellia bacterium]|nr:hypothetical protein [Blastocatellia bacterium]
MTEPKKPEYTLTIVQHTYCADCMWVKGKITDVYHASGIVRGEESMYWRVQILSPPWDRESRRAEFPSGFETVDVPALKLEVDGKLIMTTQNPSLITDLLVQLKWMLINRRTNREIEQETLAFAKDWKPQPSPEACVVAR